MKAVSYRLIFGPKLPVFLRLRRVRHFCIIKMNSACGASLSDWIFVLDLGNELFEKLRNLVGFKNLRGLNSLNLKCICEGQRPVIFVDSLTDRMVEVQSTVIYFGALHLLPFNSFNIYKYYAALRLICETVTYNSIVQRILRNTPTRQVNFCLRYGE